MEGHLKLRLRVKISPQNIEKEKNELLFKNVEGILKRKQAYKKGTRLFKFLHLCNLMTLTFNISNYEFCFIKGIHHQVAKIRRLEHLRL